MSRFCGKCDLYDCIHMNNNINADFLKNTKIYIENNILPLKIENLHDLIPYYPYIIETAGISKEDRIIRITPTSYIDIHEQKMKKNCLNRLLKEYRSAKRKHIEFKLNNSILIDKYENDIAEIIKEKGEKTTLEDIQNIHIPIAEHYRTELYNEMINNEWDKKISRLWCFGYRKEKDYPIFSKNT